MTFLKNTFVAAAALFAVSATSQASIVLQFTGRTLMDEFGTAVPAGTLIQLVNLGADGLFDPVTLADGNTSFLGQWVSGDDALINAMFITFDGANNVPGDYSAAGFDLTMTGTDLGAGRLSRQMEFADAVIPAGSKLGIRWFSGFTAEQFKTGNITLAGGENYGQFTRQSLPQQGGDLWVTPGDGGSATFDGLRTTNNGGGTDPTSAGLASLEVIVPEPATLSLALLGSLGIFALRRRR